MSRLSYSTIFETVRGVGNLLAPEGFAYLTEIPEGAPDSQLVIHLSCMAHYTPHIPQLARDILQEIGLDCIIVGGPENCCGELHKHFRDTDLEKKTARIAMAGFARAKPHTVLSICPDCDQMFADHGVARLGYRHGEHFGTLRRASRNVESAHATGSVARGGARP